MQRVYLEKAVCKYYSIEITRCEATMCYANMRGFFDFMEEKKVNRNDIYDMIIKKTNEKIGGGTLGWKLRTSKKEIKALLKPRKMLKKHPIMKIPYKSYQLMESIGEIVDEIHRAGAQFPEYLRHVYGMSYGDAFMKRQTDLFDAEYNKPENSSWRRPNPDYPPEFFLHQDLHSAPFRKIIERGK